MRIAYADPPYIGQAKRHYQSEEVDHMQLLLDLKYDGYDGWALSCSSTSLQEILGMCSLIDLKPRIAAWVKPFHIYKRNVRPAYAWEPVVYMGGRQKAVIPEKGGKATTPKDFVAANITLKKGLVGAKPEKFSLWLFNLMGMQEGDELVDLFPGTGAVTTAWEELSTQSPVVK